MYTVTYHRTDWSRPYEFDLEEQASLGIIPCGTTDSIDAWIEGALPGTYAFDPHDGDSITWVVIGLPDDRTLAGTIKRDPNTR